MTINPLMQHIEAIAKEKGIEPQVIVSALEDAMLTASRKHYKTTENLRTRLNPETGQIELYAVKHIVQDVTNPAIEISLTEAQELYGEEAEIDMEIEFPKSTEGLGRIAAQTVKQVISQKVREAERDNIYEEYSQRIGEVVTGTIKRFENGDIVAEFGRVEATLPRKEQSRAENYNVSDRVRAVIKAVNRNVKGPQIVLSRTDPALLIKLFEQEVPEIYDGTVMIRGAVREAGDRAKVAVYSRERDVDPVGACVGMKGTRVQSIIRELRGEKIDIIEYSEDPVQYATKALSPAKISRVSILSGVERHMEVIVDDTQLSLAIGKKGQNVRLAAKLLNWKIDIKSEEEKRQEVESQMAALVAPGAPVTVLLEFSVPEHIVEALAIGGITTVEKLGSMTPEELESIPSIGSDWVERLRDAVIAYYRQYDEAMGAVEEPESQEQLPAAEMGSEPSYVAEADAQHDEQPAQAVGEDAAQTEGDAVAVDVLEESDTQSEASPDESASDAESARLKDAD